MKMIIALKNEVIESKLNSFYRDKYDILIANTNQEIEQIIHSNEEFLIILRDDLDGALNFFELIEKVKEINSKNRLVVIIRKLTKEIKERLFSKEIFNIIEGNSFLLDDLIENIETPKMVIYKSKSKSINKIFFVTGTRNSGKTIFTKLLSENIALNKNKKVLVIDLDFVYPALDTYLSVDKNYSLMDFLKDFVANKLKKVENYETKSLKYKNLSYILNSKSMGIPNEEILVEMLKVLERYYDYIIIDTSSLMLNKIYSISKKINCEIIYLIEESIKSLREYILDNSLIDKSQILNTKFIINKSQKDKKILKEITKSLPVKISLIIPKYPFIEFIIKKNIRIFKLNKFLKKIGIIKFEKIKMKIIEKLLNMKEE